MKEFLEKRWWGGVGVIIALILGVPALIQFWGKVNISWLAVTIALNIILVITLALVAIWITKLKRKYEDANNRLEKSKGLLMELMKKSERQRILLSDPNHIWKLNVDNDVLTKLYGEAHGQATTKFHDAKLADLDIIVNPYKSGDRVGILFSFYSRWADRKCTFIVGETVDVHESVPSEPAKDDNDRVTFEELPWLKNLNWPQFIRKSCEKAEPLSPSDGSIYHVSTRAWQEPPWDISFRDGITGKEFRFSWDGKGDPIPWD